MVEGYGVAGEERVCALGEGKEAGETGWDQRGSDASCGVGA